MSAQKIIKEDECLDTHLRQGFHLEPYCGLMNDPNGLARFKGKYYVFFQWNRFEKNHSYKEWGYFTSEDMLDWEFLGSALVPDRRFDCDGVYSGSAIEIDGRLYIFYTGNNKQNGIRTSRQCLAVTENGKKFLKKGSVLETPEEYTQHFRDPKVFKTEHGYRMIIGAQRKNGLGAVAIASSEDAAKWDNVKTLAFTDKYEMIECPDIFCLDDQYVLTYGFQKRDNENDRELGSFAVYKPVSADLDAGVLTNPCLDDDFRYIDKGFDFYAPQTFLDEDGRRIIYGWMSRLSEKQEKILSDNSLSLHCLTIPRELSFKNGNLYQKPVREMYRLLGKNLNVFENGSEKHIVNDERTCWLRIDAINPDEKMTVNINGGEAAVETLGNNVKFKRLDWADNSMQEKQITVSRIKSLELWADNSSVEIFINDGEAVFSARIFPTAAASVIIITGLNKKTLIEAKKIVKQGGYQND